MAIKFFNVKSGEERTADTEPMISAFFNSTNLHVNALVGQDMGWRIAPETLARIRSIQGDQQQMDRIAQAFNIPMGEVKDTDVLWWISIQDAKVEAAKTQVVEGDFTREYEEKVRALESNNTDSANESDSAKMNTSKTNATKEK